MTTSASQRRAAIELDVVSTPGVRALYPHSALPGAPRVALTERDGVPCCELRIAADADVPAAQLLQDVADAVRRASGDAGLTLRIEVASID